jgi:hypothetical protein
VAVKEPGAVPASGERESQAAVVLTPQFKVPVPELLMVTACPAGLLPPCVAEKVRLAGARLMVETDGAVSESVTTTV